MLKKNQSSHHKKKFPIHMNLRKRIERFIKTKRKEFKSILNENLPKIFIVSFTCIILFFIIFLHFATSHERISNEGYFHSEKFSECIVIDGIDVSYAQGENINWKEVKRSGIDFVYIRAGFRGANNGKIYKDNTFEDNIKAANEAGLMTGAYFFSQAVTPNEAKEEANFLVDTIAPYGTDLPLVMDYETYLNGRVHNMINSGRLSIDAANQNVLAFAQSVKNQGYEPMLYGNSNFLINNVNGALLSNFMEIWVANYTTKTYYPYHYSYWQCSENSKVPGIDSPVDKNFHYLNKDKARKTNTNFLKKKKSLSVCKIELKNHSLFYYGVNVEPKVKVRDGFRLLKEGKDYNIGYIKNTSPGTGYAIITGKGNYKDSIVCSFKIKKLL